MKPRIREGAKAESDWRYYQKNKERIKLRASLYREQNKEKISEKQKMYRLLNAEHLRKYHSSPEAKAMKSERRFKDGLRAKMSCILNYSNRLGACVNCGIADLDVLTIDHVNGGGRKHRESINTHSSSSAFYRWLIRNNFPDGFQTLCYNCNLKKYFVELRESRIKNGFLAGSAF